MNPVLRCSLITLKGHAKVGQFAPSIVVPVQQRQEKRFSSNAIEIAFASENPLASALKRGTGGRSSFNGNVVTVFGATSPLGRVLVSNLTRRGTQVIVPYRGEPMDARDLKVSGDLGQVMFVPFYLRDEDSIYKAVKYSNIVVNLIGRFAETPSFNLDELHVDGARSIAKMSRLAGVKKLVHVSALNASPNPEPVCLRKGSKFLKSKYQGEVAVRDEFPDAIIFRPGWMFGIADRLFNYYNIQTRRAIFKHLPLWNSGRGIYKEPVYFIDVARGMINAIFNEYGYGQTYEAVGPRRYELHDMCRYINDHLRMGESDYNYIFDLKYSPFMQARFYIGEMMRKNPWICWEMIEFEHTTDKITPGGLTLVDLGVELETMESKAKYVLFPQRRGAWYDEALEDYVDPLPPRFQPTY